MDKLYKIIALQTVINSLYPFICYGFILLSPAAAGAEGRFFDSRTGHRYSLESTVLLNEAGSETNDVGFQIGSELAISPIWLKENERLLKFQISSPVLRIKSRKAPTPEGFVEHSSSIETSLNGPFFVHWKAGTIEQVYISKDEELSMVNYKKGVASLFQIQIIDVDVTEKDASGKCDVKYVSLDQHTIKKIKSNCILGKNVPYLQNFDKIFGAVITSQRFSKYVLSSDQTAIDSILSEEIHDMFIAIKEDASSSVKATLNAKRTGTFDGEVPIAVSTLEEAIQSVEKSMKSPLKKQILILEREPSTCKDDCPSLIKSLKENYEHLKEKNLGTVRSAQAFIKLLNVARKAKKEEFIKILKSSKNKAIYTQLSDLVGATQTLPAHEAAMKVLELELDYDLDRNERYFWALSLGSHPHPQIVTDVLKLSQKTHPNEKLSETLVLTVATLANKLTKSHIHKDHKVINEVRTSLLDGLSACQHEDCKQIYLRGLKNLGFENTIPILLEHALKGTRKTSVEAMKALRSLPSEFWDKNVLKAAKQIFYQIKRRYDSSSRTLAIDILLESDPSREDLQELIHSFTMKDKSFEVKQYLLQRLRQISENCVNFRNNVEEIIKENSKYNNYHIIGQRGLSTAFTRNLFSNPSANGSLVTIQEIGGGLLKRGIVDVVLDSSGETNTIFSLGLFAGGLSSFLSSNDVEESDEEPEPPTAGMEVKALGTQIRPFVFFSGQGELMGHVWSGTGSDKTPAFQTIALLQDHLEYIPLQIGFMAELSLMGAVSFDLSGQIQLSLWNKNAHSLVEQNAGIFVQGLIKIDSSFVKSQAEFSVSTENSLNLVSDINFSGNIALCLQLTQPDASLKHNVHKVERIPGSKHRLRKSKYKVLKVPGKTYNLNRKNNEMCNVIFQK